MMILNLEDFGVTGAATADDALDAALDAIRSRVTASPLGSLMGGGVVQVNGLYRLTRPHALGDDTVLRGCGKTTGFEMAGTLTVCDQFNGVSNNVHSDSGLESLGLYASEPGLTAAYVRGGTGVRIDRCFFAGFAAGIDWVDTDNATASRCYFGGTPLELRGTGIVVRGESNVCAIETCQFNQWRGVWHRQGAVNSVVGCNFNNPDVAVRIDGANDLSITRSNIEAAQTCGVLCDAPGQVVAVNLELGASYTGAGPLLRVVPGTVVYGLTLYRCSQQGGAHMVENGPTDIAGPVYVIATRHGGTAPIFENDISPGEPAFFLAREDYVPAQRGNVGIGTVRPEVALDLRAGPPVVRGRNTAGEQWRMP